MRDLWKTLAKENATDAVRTEGCRGCVHFGLCYHYGCCNYFIDTDELRPCPPGRGCTVKKLGDGQWPTEAEHRQELRKVIQRAKGVILTENGEQRKRGRPVGCVVQAAPKWDYEYGKKLWYEGFNKNDVAYIMGITRCQVDGISRRYDWSRNRPEKAASVKKTPGQVERAYLEYQRYKKAKEAQ